MRINDQMSIAQLKEKFNEMFKGLKMEFYKVKHSENKASSLEDQYDENTLLKSVSEKDINGHILIDLKMTVADLEKSFEEQFGFHVQVFRRSNDIWLQTSSTDYWTLEDQNTKGLHSLIQQV